MNTKSKRIFVRTTLMVVLCSLLLPGYILGKAKPTDNAPSLKGKKVLYVYGGWAGHEPKQSVDVFVPWLKSEGAEVVVSETLESYTDEKLMGSVDLIIQIWTNYQRTGSRPAKSG
jgi:hypothetical protein